MCYVCEVCCVILLSEISVKKSSEGEPIGLFYAKFFTESNFLLWPLELSGSPSGLKRKTCSCGHSRCSRQIFFKTSIAVSVVIL